MSTTLVLGLGASGLAMARWSARQGDEVRVWDSRAEPPEAAGLAEHVPAAARLPATPLASDDLAGVDRVLKSPGLAPHDAGIAALLVAAASGAAMRASLGASPGLFSTRPMPSNAAASSVPPSSSASGNSSRSAAAFGGASRESQTRTGAPARAAQRAMARPDSPRPSTRTADAFETSISAASGWPARSGRAAS